MKNIKCNLCGANDFKLLVSSGDRFYKINNPVFSIVKCNVCGLVYINPQPDQEELKKHYPESYGPYQDNFELLKYGPVLGFIKSKLNRFKITARQKNSHKNSLDKEKKTFLDFGCGSGTYLEKMKKLHPGWELYGLDNSELACRNTEAKGFKVFCGDILDINMPEGFFDEVYLGQVIEHTSDPRKTAIKLSKIMKKGGTLTIITPNVESFAAKLFGRFWFALEVPRHLFLFSAKTLSKLLKESGFAVESIIYDHEPKTAIRSLSYLFWGKSVGISPIFWHTLWYLLKPASSLLALFGKTSIMTIKAKKL